MPVEHAGRDIEQIEQQSNGQLPPRNHSPSPYENPQYRPAINTQAAHANSDGRTCDHKASGWILVAKARKEIANQQRCHRVAPGQQRRRHRGRSHCNEGQKNT